MTRKEYLEKLRDHYSLFRTLSRKNGSEVLCLKHRELGKCLVLRSMPEAVRTYDALLDIRSPFLPEVYESVLLDDGQVVLEEYIDGISVADELEFHRYSYKDARPILRGVLSALSILHSKKIVHRDVKPDNVMLEKSGRVVLVDLNASRFVSGLHRDTVIMGTVGFIAPEQLGLKESDARTDIYAVGTLLNVMITGSLPSEQKAKGKAARIIKKCLQIHPDDRYQSAEELLNALLGHCPMNLRMDRGEKRIKIGGKPD